jgi:hypothetical protein
MVAYDDNTIAGKALRLKASLGDAVLVGVGGNTIHVYSDRGFRRKVPEIWEEVKVEHHKNVKPRPAKQE